MPDHHLMITFRGQVFLLNLLLMIGKRAARPRYRLWRYRSDLDLLCCKRLPCGSVTPINIGTIAALVRATEATPNEEGASRHIEPVRVDDPIVSIFSHQYFLQSNRGDRTYSCPN